MVATSAPIRQDDVMALLDQGVPLTLLVDLVDRQGPRSAEILATERELATVALAAV